MTYLTRAEILNTDRYLEAVVAGGMNRDFYEKLCSMALTMLDTAAMLANATIQFHEDGRAN